MKSRANIFHYLNITIEFLLDQLLQKNQVVKYFIILVQSIEKLLPVELFWGILKCSKSIFWTVILCSSFVIASVITNET